MSLNLENPPDGSSSVEGLNQLREHLMNPLTWQKFSGRSKLDEGNFKDERIEFGEKSNEKGPFY